MHSHRSFQQYRLSLIAALPMHAIDTLVGQVDKAAEPRHSKTARLSNFYLILCNRLEFFYEESSYRIEHCEYHDADVGEYRKPHVCYAERAERKTYQLDAYCKNDILVDDS